MRDTLAHLLKYDSILGNLKADITAKGDRITVAKDEFQVLSVKDPAQLPWKDLGVDVVFESTGIFTDREAAAKHVDRRGQEGRDHRAGEEAGHHHGAGRERRRLRPGEAPHHLERVVHDQLPGADRQGAARAFGIRKGWMTTVHSYTNDQQLLDLPHKDLRRARAAALSIIPTTTGAAVGGRRGAAGAEGQAGRHRDARADAERLGGGPGGDARQEDVEGRGERGVQGGRGRAAQGHPRVRGRAARLDRLQRQRALVDPRRAVHQVMDGDFVKILAWYDNEWGYSNRCVDLLAFLQKKGL